MSLLGYPARLLQHVENTVCAWQRSITQRRLNGPYKQASDQALRGATGWPQPARRLRRFGCLLVLAASTWCLPAQAQLLPPLLQAARDGDWTSLDRLLADGGDARVTWGDGSTALHWASHHDWLPAARQLLDAGADVNATTDLGITPLWLAAENGSTDLVNLLLNAGADPTVAQASGETPLAIASLAGSAAVVRLLLVAGADPNVTLTRQQTPLMWAAGQGHGEVVEALLAGGAVADTRTEVRNEYVKTEKEQDSHPAYKTWREEGGYTALMFAAAAGDLVSTRALVAAGSSPNEPAASGITPAIMAVYGGNTAVLELLLDAGAEVNLAPIGHGPLHAAVLRGNLEAVTLLLSRGADPNLLLQQPTPTRRQSSDYHFHDSLVGTSPLWLAARFAEPAIMASLLKAGADPHRTTHVSYPAQRNLGENFIADEGEISILMAAVGMGNRRLRLSWWTPERRAGQVDRDREAAILQASELAVRAGVDLNLRDANGQSALDFARARRYGKVVAFLEGAGALAAPQ